MSKIITIGREFGSGGRELGKRLAENLGIAYYDNEIVDAIVKHSNLAEEYVNQILENRIVRYFPITVSHTFANVDYSHYDIENRVYSAQVKAIEELAEKSDCVVVGRCADFILRNKKPIRLFVYADMEQKIARCREKNEEDRSLTDKALKQKILGVDKGRARYYEFFTGNKWGDRKNYDICVNTTNISIKHLAESLAETIKKI